MTNVQSTVVALPKTSAKAGLGNQIFGLLGETFPTGSVKFVSVLGMMAHLENTGALGPHVERVYASTSGNTGLAAASLCADRGLEFHAVVDARIEAEKEAALVAAGAQVVRVNGDVLDRVRIAKEMSRVNPNSVDLDQYGNPGALLGHFQVTGPAIWQEMRGQVDALVVAIGTGGTFGGVAAFLTQQKPDLITIAVDAYGSALVHGKVSRRLLTGVGCGFIPNNVRRAYRFIRSAPYVAHDGESFRAARWLREHEGIGVGGSGGAVLCAGLDLARRVDSKRILLLFHDGAEAYQSTVFSDEWMSANGFM